MLITPALRARFEIERRIDELLDTWDPSGLTWLERYEEAEAQVLKEMNALKGASHG